MSGLLGGITWAHREEPREKRVVKTSPLTFLHYLAQRVRSTRQTCVRIHGVTAVDGTKSDQSELLNTERIFIAGILSEVCSYTSGCQIPLKNCVSFSLCRCSICPACSTGGREGGRYVIKCKQGSHDAIQTHIILPRCHCLKRLGRSFPVARRGFRNSSELVWSCRALLTCTAPTPRSGTVLQVPAHGWAGILKGSLFQFLCSPCAFP